MLCYERCFGDCLHTQVSSVNLHLQQARVHVMVGGATSIVFDLVSPTDHLDLFTIILHPSYPSTKVLSLELHYFCS
jgi:hypothetical protein